MDDIQSSRIIRRGDLPRVIVYAAIYTVMGIGLPLQQETITVTYVAGLVVVGLLYGVLLSSVMGRMGIGRRGSIITVMPAIFVIQYFNPMIEGFFFTTRLNDPVILVMGAIFGLLLAAVYAIVAMVLFGSSAKVSTLGSRFKEYISARARTGWIWRFIVVASSWLVIYFAFGSIAGPYVLPFYEDPNSPYQLVQPSLQIVLVIQFIRGFLYVGSLTPLLVSLRSNLKELIMVMTGFLYIGGGLGIFVIVESFPAFMRIVHGLEIFADSLFFGVVIAYLLRRPE